MDYTMLAAQDFEGLRRERITTLEVEHYRLSLLLLETTDADTVVQLLARQDEYERRIAMHRAELIEQNPESIATGNKEDQTRSEL